MSRAGPFGITSASGVGGSPYTLSVIGTLGNANYNIVARNSGRWTVTAVTSADPDQFASTVANGVLHPAPWFMAPMMEAFVAEATWAGAGMTIFGGGIFSTEFSNTRNSGTNLFYADIRFGP